MKDKSEFNKSMLDFIKDMEESNSNFQQGCEYWFVDIDLTPRMILYDENNKYKKNLKLYNKTFRSLQQAQQYSDIIKENGGYVGILNKFFEEKKEG